VIAPALGAKTPDAMASALSRSDVSEAAELLGDWSRGGARVAGACTATFVLAAAGILDGGEATTTWWLSPLFRERYPRVALDESRMIVQSRRVITAGAALAHVDLALWLVRHKSPALAHATARYLVFDARPSQAAYAMADHLAHDDAMVQRFEHWARRHLADFSLAVAARHVGVSERTLERRIRAVLGARRSATSRTCASSSPSIACAPRATPSITSPRRSATATGVTLRTLLRKKTGRGIRELRASG
jgi:transcriptional regulator GlxA family with amidase domain